MATVKKSKLKVISETELVNSNNVTKQTKYYELSGRRFRIVFENSNGSPLGFNYKKCLSQYDPTQGKWNNLEDISVITLSHYPSYFDQTKSLAYLKEFFTKMEEHLITVYS